MVSKYPSNIVRMVFVPELNKNIWGGYIPPKKDEIFSSWFLRLAQAHLLKSHSFSKLTLKGYSLWNRDNDIYPNDFLIKTIEINTPLSLVQINNLFLINYEGFLFERINKRGFTIGIIPLKMYHRKRTGKGIMYCPCCLKNNHYYKKQWRVFYSIACLECGVLLRDDCPECENPVTYHRLEQGNKNEILNFPLNYCAYCHSDLCKNPIRASKTILQFQKKINTYLQNGFTENLVYSHQFFEMLYKVSALISREHDTWGRLRKACCIEFGNIPAIIDKPFYLSSLKERIDILLLSFKLLENLTLFESLIRKHNVRLSEITKDKMIPFYYDNRLKFAK